MGQARVVQVTRTMETPMMFDSLRGMAGMAGIMKDLPRIKAKLKEVKEEVTSRTVEARSAGGEVVAVASGRMRIVSLEISPDAICDFNDAEQLARLVTETSNEALDKAQEMASQAIKNAAEDLGLNIPQNALEGLL